MPTTVLGAIEAQLLADVTLCLGFPTAMPPVPPLVPPDAVTTEEVPESVPSPPSIVLEDDQAPPEWITQTSRTEKHAVRATCYGGQATTVGAANPAELIADNIERIVNWDDLGIAGSITIGVRRNSRTPALEKTRGPDGNRVYSVRLEWLINLWVGP